MHAQHSVPLPVYKTRLPEDEPSVSKYVEDIINLKNI